MEYTDIELKNEQWRDIDGYDGAYQVSDLGRVRSLKFGKTRVLRAYKNRYGYLKVFLWKDGKRYNIYVHRLVAQAFIPNNDDAKNEINHINELKSDNRASNLEWCDRRYNNTYNGLRYRRRHPNYRRNAIKDLYDPELSIDENLELFKAKGVSCSRHTVINLRKDIGLTKQHELKRHKLKELYRPDLSINENISLFKENGIECSRCTIWRIRKYLGLIK